MKRLSLDDVRQLPDEVLTVAQIAAVLGCDQQHIRCAARDNPAGLGFSTIVMGSRVLVPRKAFVRFMEGIEDESQS